MSFNKKTVRDFDLRGKTVLMRADYNVPMTAGLTISDDYRLRKSLPTIQYLLEQDCKIIITSHLGRPDGKRSPKESLNPVAVRLSELLVKGVKFVNDCIGDDVRAAAHAASSGDVLLLENVRFHPEEEGNDERFARQMVEDTGAEVFVQDCFGVAHRAHASIVGVANCIPAVAGLLLEREVDTITRVMEEPTRPLMAIIGGAKISDKIEILDRMLDVADIVVIGGALSTTFLLAQGHKVGKSLVEPDSLDTAHRIMARASGLQKEGKLVFYMPQDGVVAEAIDEKSSTRIVDFGSHVIADVMAYPAPVPRNASEVGDSEMLLDVGPFSVAFIVGAMQLAGTVIWNGALGVTETTGLQGPVGPFSHGTELLLEGLRGQFGHKPFSVIGGGDTVGYIEGLGMTEMFDHVSTGGGASMELMSGRSLPGVDVLWDKE